MSVNEIFCLLIHDSDRKDRIGNAFEVSLGEGESIAALKEKVKEKKNEELDDVAAADHLRVWRLCRPQASRKITPDFLANVRLLEDDTGEDNAAYELFPEERIGDEWPDGVVHVLVQRPKIKKLLSEPFHILVERPAPQPAPSCAASPALETSNAEFQGENSDRPLKRQRTTEKTMLNDAEKGGQLIKTLREFQKQYWGNPLPSDLTTLPMDYEGQGMLTSGENIWDDVLPGDPFVKVIKERFLVRAEYLRVFNMVEDVFKEFEGERMAVVVGQPGIGKTTWIDYAMRRLAGERREFCLFQSENFYEISANGVRVSKYPLERSTLLWCLVDSTEADPLPTKITKPVEMLFPIYVTSPKKRRWATLHQVRMPKLVIMNPWTRGELERARAELRSNLPHDEVARRFEKAGPSARICFNYTETDIEEFYEERARMIKFNTRVELAHSLAIDPTADLGIDDVSHKLCVIRRLQGESSRWSVDPISMFVRRQLMVHLWVKSEEERIASMRLFARLPGGMHGLAFESHYQHEFAEEINIVALPMFRTGRKRSNWHATFGDFSGRPRLRKALEEQPPTGNPIVLSIRPKEFRVYRCIDEDQHIDEAVEQNVYYVPFASNEVVMDAFIVIDFHLYMFQFTSGREHSLSDQVAETVDRVMAKADFTLHDASFIFVVPEDQVAFSCPHPEEGDLGFFDGEGTPRAPYIAQVNPYTKLTDAEPPIG